jgi:superfamily II DNA or RNA helicase
VFPTGGGKTLVGICDALRQFETGAAKTIVVVAPRILLAEQLSAEYLGVYHRPYASCSSRPHAEKLITNLTTNPAVISWLGSSDLEAQTYIFTTYNSLQQLQRADIKVDTIYFDEAHNSIQRHFFPAVEYFCTGSRSLLTSLLRLPSTVM